MNSQFHERLRAARKTAGLTQLQMAKALGISRSAYAFYEFSEDKGQTRPNIDQVRVISSMTKVPVEVLLDDKLSTTDVMRAAMGDAPVVQPAPAAHGEQAPKGMRELFWSAVQFSVLSADPARAGGFGASAYVGPMPVPVDYQSGRTCAVLLAEPTIEEAREALGRLLVLEKLARRTMAKVLLIWTREARSVGELATAALTELGVAVAVVTTADQAARAILEAK